MKSRAAEAFALSNEVSLGDAGDKCLSTVWETDKIHFVSV